MSEKGQVVIPKSVRDAVGFAPGVELEVASTAAGVVLRKAADRPRLTLEEAEEKLRSIYQHVGPPVTLAEMDDAVAHMWANGGSRWDD